MVSEGLDEGQARSRVFMVDRCGLLVDNMDDLLFFQQPLAQSVETVAQWQLDEPDNISLLEVVNNAKPTILIGVSGQPGLFTEQVIRSMAEHVTQPVVLPLSNPTSRAEAHPQDVLNWTEGRAIVATGSPFENVTYDGQPRDIAQCNNSYIFPGIGLGVLAVKATRITENMLMASSRALAECSPMANDANAPLLPALVDIREVSKKIARAVAKQAMADGVAFNFTDEALDAVIEKNFWEPQYRDYRRTSF